ncbi:MAG TPA: NAD-dependent epimerase/dehydratase family protein [Terriglobia bacterium]|nr:NAD-dependent epimerase/dehydratase family protein [Terriglobia bacterium]
MKLRLAITGSSGYLAQQLIARLGADPEVEFILGLDIRRAAPKVACAAEFLEYDITRPWNDLRKLFASHGINTGLHLAWQFNPIHNLGRHRDVDVQGSGGFFRAAAEAGLKRVVYTSSTTAYTDAGNPETPLTEETPVSGTPLYLYSRHKGEVDRMAQEFARAHPAIQVLILRPCIVLGAHTKNVVSTMIEWPWPRCPWVIQVRGADPPMQYISEEDIAEILYRAVKSDATGSINCAGDGVLRLSVQIRMLGKKPLPIPAALVYPLAELLWALRLSPFPAGILDMIRYPWVADNTRLKQVLGYQPRATTLEAIEAYAAARRSPGS